MSPRNADIQLSPQARYEADLKGGEYQRDAAQARAVARLHEVYEQLISRKPTRRLGLRARNSMQWPPVKGLYMWGGVGRGKTYLMDTFYDALPFSKKRRTHFHRFMQDVHERRKHYQNEQDPLVKVAAEIAAETRVLCFDEFFVSDIADAMILGRLTECLFSHGITLVTTSNIPPNELYKNGLQRERFLPAIERIQQHCHILEVDGGTDYRLRVLQQAEIYHHPLDDQAEDNLQNYFRDIAPNLGQSDADLELHGRRITTRRLADGVAWFDFNALCSGPRGAADYTEIARCYQTVLLSKVPGLTWEMENEARRFITLVDEFYDHNVKLIISAAEPLETLYSGKKLTFEFERTVSRLQEMQSQEYLARPHMSWESSQ